MAERIVQVSPKIKSTSRSRVLVVAWPPIRDGGPWTIEARGDREALSVRIVVPPIADLDDPRAELLAEDFIRARIPRDWHELLYPGSVVASETLLAMSPCDYLMSRDEARLIREIQELARDQTSKTPQARGGKVEKGWKTSGFSTLSVDL